MAAPPPPKAHWESLRRPVRRFGSAIRKEVSSSWETNLLPAPMRRSLSLRMGGIMAGATALVVLFVSIFIATHIRDGIFDQRLEQLLSDAAVRSQEVQSQLDSSPSTSSSEEVQALTYQLVLRVQSAATGAGVYRVGLLRSPRETSQFVINEPGADQITALVSKDLRRSVQAHPENQYWQSIAITDPEGNRAPGVAVGSTLQLPLAGAYEFYIVYSLANDQAAINLVIRVLAVGFFALMLLVMGVTWVVVYRVLVPVRHTVRTAERLANGDMEARVHVRGQDEMAQLAASFNHMADSMSNQINQLAELSQLQQRFVSDVSHELRTPLTTMRIADDVIYDARDQLDPAAARSAELLHDQIERFDSMLADLLEISRIDSGGAQLTFEAHDLCALVQAVVVNNLALVEKIGCPVNTHFPDHPCMAEVDHRRITRVVRNLLVNAVEHSEGRPVDITVATTDTAVAVRVRDHGVGMSPEVTARVFDRFFRADPARARTTGGTGLGLAISLEDARLSGGDLQAWGKPGEGSSFLLILPRKVGVPAGPSPLALTDYLDDDPEPPAITASIPLSPGLMGSTATPVSTALVSDPDALGLVGDLHEPLIHQSDLVSKGLAARLEEEQEEA